MDFGAIQIMDDSQAAIAMAKNPVHHKRTKHIDVRHHFIRNEIAQKTINLQYCTSKEMIADALTKPIPKQQFQQLRTGMGLHDITHMHNTHTHVHDTAC